MGAASRQWAWFAGWSLWKVPARVRVYVLGINVLAVISTLATAWLMPVEHDDLTRFGLLAGCTVVAIGLTRRIERKREYVRSTKRAYIDTKSVWSFAAVLVLPPVLASAMVLITYLVAWFCIWPRTRPVETYRWVFSCATVLCGSQAAVAVLMAGVPTYPGIPVSLTATTLLYFLAIILAAVLRWVINVALVMVAIAVSNPTITARELFANFSAQYLEAGAMSLGLVAGAVVVDIPVVLPGIVLAMAAMHGGVLLGQYERASRIDTKTGLVTAGRWHEFAEQTFARTDDRCSAMGLLVVDLDHFKAVNDTYGHPFGDHVLQAVAAELKAEIREEDACGRWGGEEFAIVLPDVADPRNLRRVAERIRLRVESLRLSPPGNSAPYAAVTLTTSVGGALYPGDGITSLDELILAADSALYEAKRSGRNQVCLAPSGQDGVPKPAPSPEESTGVIPPRPVPD